LNFASLRPHLVLWGLRCAWALAIGLWALALVPWFKTPRPLPDATTAASRATGASVATVAPAREPIEEIIDPGEPVMVPARTAESRASAAQRPPRDTGVCGLGEPASGATGEAPSAVQRANHLARQANLGLQQALDGLRTSSAPSAQAAAWWLRVLLARDTAPGSAPASPACAPGADCPVAESAAAVLPVAEVDALAQLAQTSSDAWVQQVALRACDGVASVACTSLGTRRWSTLQPDNAAAWLELAARDPQSVDEALFRAARASRFDSLRGQLVAQVLLATPERAPAMQRYAAWQRADELDRAAETRAAAAAARSCSEAARRDANRDQLCDGAARWLLQWRPPAADAAASRALDCASVDRQWREARDAALRGTPVATSQANARP
jgi:hypothetical protein